MTRLFLLPLVVVWPAQAHADEHLRFVARWMGVEAGFAEASAAVIDGIRVVTLTAKNAGWLDGIYPIDDRIISEAHVAGPGLASGSTRYRTWFHEGRFEQEQDMHFHSGVGGPGTVEILRHQRTNGLWGDSPTQLTFSGAAEDPISAFYRVREANLRVGDALHLPVFNGRRTLDIVARCEREEPGPDGQMRRYVSVRSVREGDYSGGIDLYLSADNIPSLAVVQTRAGPVRIEVQ